MDGVSTCTLWLDDRNSVMVLSPSWGSTAALQHCSVMSRSAVDHFMESVTSYKQNAAVSAVRKHRTVTAQSSQPAGARRILTMYC